MAGCDLLVDGRNSIYRAVHANRSNPPGSRRHSLTVMLSFIAKWLARFEPHRVHVFWDAHKTNLWRRKLLPTYKDRDTDPDISAECSAVEAAAIDVFKYMNIRQYRRDTMEADDLIYSMCKVVTDRKLVVASSDGDFKQLATYFRHVELYEPRKNEMVELSKCNPVFQKALMGDTSDNVIGYDGVGPVKSATMADDAVIRNQFLKDRGNQAFVLNLLLVDLSLCPYAAENMLYVGRSISAPVEYDKAKALSTAQSHLVNGFLMEYESKCHLFKRLV